MMFTKIEEAECSNTFKGLLDGVNQVVYNPYKVLNKRIYRCANQQDSRKHGARCTFCLISENIAKKQTLLENVSASKKLKFDPSLREKLPRSLSSPCAQCLTENNDALKQGLRDIVLFWFKDLSGIWKVMSNFRKLTAGNEKLSPTYQWVLWQYTNTTLTLVTIPIMTIEDPTLLLHKSYAFVYNQKEKELSSYAHKHFSINIPEKAFVDCEVQVNHIFLHLKKFASKDTKRSKRSLSLVKKANYIQLYSNLKEKYMSYFVNMWSGMADSLYSVCKGISIATYLLLLWEEERQMNNCEDKQSFIHLKCGNGLLVHILTNEGHPGKGIDTARHTMWDSYGSGITLEESPIYPHKLKVEAEWVIGYDADELSPWIPIIAARSSYTTRFFLSSSFHYNLDQTITRGEGYDKVGYDKYLRYVTTIGEDCGFIVEQDALYFKINRLSCLVGSSRSSKVEMVPWYSESIDEVVQDILKAHSCSVDIDKAEDLFKITKGLENCREIDNSAKEEVYEAVIKKLLSKQNIGFGGEDKLTSSGHKWSEWNAGGNLHISEIEKLVNPDALKNYPGGVQSILKWHKGLFVLSNEMVSFRDYRNPKELHDRRKIIIGNQKQVAIFDKTYECWFCRCHPQGCVLGADECPDAHGVEDMNQFYFY